MKIAIDSGPVIGGDSLRGIGLHTRELYKEFEKLKNDKFEFDLVDFSKTDLSKYDLVHYQSFNPYRTHLPFLKPARKVVLTIHDLIYLIYPNAYPSGIKGRLNFYLQKINLRNIDAIITISETSKKDIVRFLNIDSNKIFVIYLSAQRNEQKIENNELKQKLPEKYVLYIGDVNYNKNLLTLAKACKLANLKLVMIGKQSAVEEVSDNIEDKPWKEFLKYYKNDEDVIRLGFVNNFNKVFKNATVYCQPSYYEGFGLPILEAFERKVPVVSSRTQALVEVGNDACVYFDPRNEEDLANKLKKLFANKNKRDELIKKGTERLKYFSWKKCAEETLGVYEKI